MYSLLPQTSEEFARLNWSEIEPWYRELQATSLSRETLQPWLLQWSRLSELVDEVTADHEIACMRDTADQDRELRQKLFLGEIYTQVQFYDQKLKEQLLESTLSPAAFAIPLRNLRAEAELFCEANVPLLNEEKRLIMEYFQVGGAQKVLWEGKEVGISALAPVLAGTDRARREQAWHVTQERQLADRAIRNEQWVKLLQLRQQIARNAGYENYRDYRWKQLLRFDYTPADSLAFHTLIEQELVPVANALWEKRRQALGVETLRPWDQKVDPWGPTSPRLISDVDEVLQHCATLFRRVDPTLGSHFEIMLREHLLDLEERPNKAQAGFQSYLPVRQRPFIFGHVNSLQGVVSLLFHEMGHAFHSFEMNPLPFSQQKREGMVPTEFAEVASISMELIGSMHLCASGLCTQAEEVQMRMQHLENFLVDYIPSIVQGDAFQHWIYEHPEQAMDPNKLGQKWAELRKIYFPTQDWSGLENELSIGWQRTLHFYYVPFSLLEYTFAALGALQIWSNYTCDQETALRQYRYALSLGATKTVPELYEAAGASFSFNASTLRSLIHLITQTVEELKTRL